MRNTEPLIRIAVPMRNTVSGRVILLQWRPGHVLHLRPGHVPHLWPGGVLHPWPLDVPHLYPKQSSPPNSGLPKQLPERGVSVHRGVGGRYRAQMSVYS